MIIDGKIEDIETYMKTNYETFDNQENSCVNDAYSGLLLSQTLGNYGIAQAISYFAYKVSDKDLDSFIITPKEAIES